TMIGNICLFCTMKTIILQMTKVVNFFNSSHYWGGQLNDEARKLGVKWKMKQNCESHFYALILKSLSVLAYWYVLNKVQRY
ncbi:hypothetical protein BDR04DRAFT_1028417, partial [Suillus decipiens]